MKNIYYWLVCILLCSYSLYAQNGEGKEPNFEHLEGHRVPYGLLLDKAKETYNTRLYNGVLREDNLSSNIVFSSLLQTIETAYTNGNRLQLKPFGDSLWESIRKEEQPELPILALLYKMSCIRADALEAQLIDFRDGVVRDKYIQGQWQNPYQDLDVCAATVSLGVVYSRSLSYVLHRDNLYSNQSVQKVELDAGDGLGFRTMALGSKLNVTYTSEAGLTH